MKEDPDRYKFLVTWSDQSSTPALPPLPPLKSDEHYPEQMVYATKRALRRSSASSKWLKFCSNSFRER